jgi:hypothetical protein
VVMVAPVAAEAATKDEARTRAVVAGVAAVTPTQTLKRRARMARAMAPATIAGIWATGP